MDYYKEEVRKKILHDIERAETLAKAWRGIERYKTKDGKDFKNLAQNFTKGAIRAKTYAPSEREIGVHARSEAGNYFDDWLNISITVYSDSEEAKRYEAEGRLIERGAYLHPYVNKTPDEIEKNIDERAKYYEDEAKTLKDFLRRFDEVADKIVEMKKQAETYIGEQPKEVYYCLRNILREERD